MKPSASISSFIFLIIKYPYLSEQSMMDATSLAVINGLFTDLSPFYATPYLMAISFTMAV